MGIIFNRARKIFDSYVSDRLERRDYSIEDDSDKELKRIIDKLTQEQNSKKEDEERQRFSKEHKEYTNAQKERAKNDTKAQNSNIKFACTTLGVSENASVQEIKDAYRKQMHKFHPDKAAKLGPDFVEIANQKTKEINYAYNILKQAKNF